jgi:hypothetical protein
MAPGLALAAFMAVTIVGTVVFGKAIALASALIFVLAILVLAVRDIRLALAAYVAYSAMEGMYKYLTEFSQAIYVIKPILIGMILFVWLVSSHFQRARRKLPPMSGWIVLLLLWGAVQTLHPYGRGVVEGIGALLIWYGLPILLLPLLFNTMKRRTDAEQLTFAIIAICAVVCAFSIVQFKMGRPWTEAHLPGYASITATDWWTTDAAGNVVTASFRPASTTSQGGGGGYWGHFGAMLALSCLVMPGISFRCRAILAVCLLVNVMGILVSGVRLYVLLIPIEGLVWILLTARTLRDLIRNLGLTVIGAAVMYGGFMGAQALSNGAIAQRYADTLSDPFNRFTKDRGLNFTFLPDFLVEFPLGVGFQHNISGGAGTVTLEGALLVNRETVFNSLAADMGFPGLVLGICLLIGIPWTGWRLLRTLRTSRLATGGAMLLSLLIGFAVMGFGGPSLQGADFYWLFAGLLFAMPVIEQHDRTGAADTMGKTNTSL